MSRWHPVQRELVLPRLAKESSLAKPSVFLLDSCRAAFTGSSCPDSLLLIRCIWCPLRQAFEAARYAGCASHLIPVNLNYERFRAVNTSKGSWALLDHLTTVRNDAGATAAFEAPIATTAEAAPKAALSLSAVTSIVGEVATAIIGEILQGKSNVTTDHAQSRSRSSEHCNTTCH